MTTRGFKLGRYLSQFTRTHSSKFIQSWIVDHSNIKINIVTFIFCLFQDTTIETPRQVNEKLNRTVY